jgi:hypothetical protein
MAESREARLLTLNLGSSSLKAGLYQLPSAEAAETAECLAIVERIGPAGSRLHVTNPAGATLLDRPGDLADFGAALDALFGWLREAGRDAGLAAIGHRVVHGHPHTERFHVRGFREQGTTTTPFDMVALNEMSRYHLAAEAILRVPRLDARASALIEQYRNAIARAHAYGREHLEDPPELRDWVWPY